MLLPSQSPAQSKVLLVTTCRWFATARLASALAQTGLIVEAASPADHPASLLSNPPRHFPFSGLAPIASILAAIRTSHPNLVIPCDDLARIHLRNLQERFSSAKSPDPAHASWLRPLLDLSLGKPDDASLIDSRTTVISTARSLRICAPETSVLSTESQLKQWLDENGLPAVLKTDGTSGGTGVRVVHTTQEAIRAFQFLNRPPLALRAVKRALVDRDLTLLTPALKRRRPVVNIQRFIPGSEATLAMACYQGKVVASIATSVVHTWGAKGPASVVCRIDHPEMDLAAQHLAARLGLSGMHGLDFILDGQSGRPWLIEMNARATQTCHLPLGTGHDLPAALHAALTGQPPPVTRSITSNNTIALFPLEWQIDPASHWLRDAWHDVPWEHPALVRKSISTPLPGTAWYSAQGLASLYAKLPWHND